MLDQLPKAVLIAHILMQVSASPWLRRVILEPFRNVGIYAQGEVGIADATSDVLATYGYKNADSIGLYAGGLIGLEWYQVSPHYALALQGGARFYPNLARSIGGDTAVALLGAAALRYTF